MPPWCSTPTSATPTAKRRLSSSASCVRSSMSEPLRVLVAGYGANRFGGLARDNGNCGVSIVLQGFADGIGAREYADTIGNQDRTGPNCKKRLERNLTPRPRRRFLTSAAASCFHTAVTDRVVNALEIIQNELHALDPEDLSAHRSHRLHDGSVRVSTRLLLEARNQSASTLKAFYHSHPNHRRLLFRRGQRCCDSFRRTDLSRRGCRSSYRSTTAT